MTHHGVKQNTLPPFGQEIVCGNPTVHRWISEEPNFSTGHSVPIENPRYSSGARRTGPHLAHAKTNNTCTNTCKLAIVECDECTQYLDFRITHGTAGAFCKTDQY